MHRPSLPAVNTFNKGNARSNSSAKHSDISKLTGKSVQHRRSYQHIKSSSSEQRHNDNMRPSKSSKFNPKKNASKKNPSDSQPPAFTILKRPTGDQTKLNNGLVQLPQISLPKASKSHSSTKKHEAPRQLPSLPKEKSKGKNKNKFFQNLEQRKYTRSEDLSSDGFSTSSEENITCDSTTPKRQIKRSSSVRFDLEKNTYSDDNAIPKSTPKTPPTLPASILKSNRELSRSDTEPSKTAPRNHIPQRRRSSIAIGVGAANSLVQNPLSMNLPFSDSKLDHRYAGPTFHNSPEPSALPIPTFLSSNTSPTLSSTQPSSPTSLLPSSALRIQQETPTKSCNDEIRRKQSQALLDMLTNSPASRSRQISPSPSCKQDLLSKPSKYNIYAHDAVPNINSLPNSLY